MTSNGAVPERALGWDDQWIPESYESRVRSARSASNALDTSSGRAFSLTVAATDQVKLRTRFDEYVRKKGLKSTTQRDVIVDQFLRSKGHISIEDLLAK